MAVFSSFACHGIEVKGNGHLHLHLHLNEDGLIDSIEVAWRSLPSTVLVQEVFAGKPGFPAMRLVPVEAAA